MKLIKLTSQLMSEARVGGMSQKMWRFMEELVYKSLPDTLGTPTKAFAKEHLRISNPDLADLELRGLVEVKKGQEGPVVYPTKEAVELFKLG